MRTARGFERLTMFADAVVAIAITLLIFPLVDLPLKDSESVGHMLSGHLSEVFAFLVSFVVIARLWVAFHSVGEFLAKYDAPVMVVTMLWLLTVAFLPFPSELLGSRSNDNTVYVLYIGTLLVNTCCLAALTYLISSRPALRREGVTHAAIGRMTAAWWSNPLLLATALVLALTVPSIGIKSLLLLLLDDLITRLVLRRRRRRTSKVAPD